MRLPRTPFAFKINLSSFYCFKAPCANVTRYRFAVGNIGNLLDVGFESPSRPSLGMADVVTGSLTFTANAANSRHIFVPPWDFKLK